jgi:putative ABC transport system ATP-binding protein
MQWNGGDVTLLSARDVRKTFGATVALESFEIDVESGEIVALLGRSGSGKSTALLCLGAILACDHGEIQFEGRHIESASARERALLRRTSFGFVFQFGHLVPEVPLVDNVSLPLLFAGAGRRAARVEARAWLERMGIGALADRLPGEVSGGEGQRAAVARALVHRPQVVFADEPTGSLDSANGSLVMDLLVEHAGTVGAAVVLATHDESVAGAASRRLTIQDGRNLSPTVGQA